MPDALRPGLYRPAAGPAGNHRHRRRDPQRPHLAGGTGHVEGFAGDRALRIGMSFGNPSGRLVSATGPPGAGGFAVVLVSSEVGLTLVPTTASGRLFSDALGTVNQRLAAVCDRVL
ncbi:bifunctional adenosylcobinamide kinase/adenosylcobinamide-phosphate guanylyltransferase, partial [Mycolicibacterium insubricum]|nr:bifunctional adenosylcobinamide kinase/adenosylcobinamide-phosphate guanylyltransferase [Mycolicibacterium insubricum]